MSKELEYIQRQINIVKQQVKGSKVKIIVTDTVTKYRYDYYERELQTLENIEQALDRLEAIDNSNPSEALEILDDFKNGLINKEIGMVMFQQYWFFNQIEKVKQALLKLQEQEKGNATCWNIVVKKNVDMLLIKKYDNVSDYNSAVWLSGREKLTEEEFNTLKEVLE